MLFPKDKKALSVKEGGHYIFSLILLALAILIILQFTKIPILKIIQDNLLLSLGLILTFIIFSAFIDQTLEPPGSYNHRGFFHSKTFLILTLILIPITIEKAIKMNINFLFITAALAGHTSHLFGDSLTKKLKKW